MPHLIPVDHATLRPCPQCGARHWLQGVDLPLHSRPSHGEQPWLRRRLWHAERGGPPATHTDAIDSGQRPPGLVRSR